MGTAQTASGPIEQGRSTQMEQAHPEQPHEDAETALIPSTEVLEAEPPAPLRGLVSSLPVEVSVAVPLRDFRLRNLLALAPGVLVESEWEHGDDLPLACGDVQLAWTEFEVIDMQLAVRLTRLA
jgi:flagellar motor switch protein FliN/FliY